LLMPLLSTPPGTQETNAYCCAKPALALGLLLHESRQIKHHTRRGPSWARPAHLQLRQRARAGPSRPAGWQRTGAHRPARAARRQGTAAAPAPQPPRPGRGPCAAPEGTCIGIGGAPVAQLALAAQCLAGIARVRRMCDGWPGGRSMQGGWAGLVHRDAACASISTMAWSSSWEACRPKWQPNPARISPMGACYDGPAP
jgi:hypothetical protein